MIPSLILTSLFVLIAPFSSKIGHQLVRLFGRVWLSALGVEVHAQGLNHFYEASSFIVAPTHQSNADVFVLQAYSPLYLRYISKVAVAAIPMLGLCLWIQGSYFVWRNRSSKDLSTMKRVEEDLQGGVSVLAFPEGTRSKTGELLPLKKGPFRLAQNSGVPLLPVAIRGTYGIAPSGKIPTRRGHLVGLHVGQPFYVAAEASLEAEMTRFKGVLAELFERA